MTIWNRTTTAWSASCQQPTHTMKQRIPIQYYTRRRENKVPLVLTCLFLGAFAHKLISVLIDAAL